MKKYLTCLFAGILAASCVSDNKHVIEKINDSDASFLLKDFGDFSEINGRNTRGNTLLHEIVLSGERELPQEKKIRLIKTLVRSGADINCKNAGGETPLHLVATQDRKTGLAKILLELNARVDVKTANGETPLDYCGYNLFFYYNDELVGLLIKHGADPDSFNRNGSTLLHVLCAYYGGDYGVENYVENLVKRGADINIREKKTGNTPLMNAVQRNAYAQTKVISVLINSGADINCANNDGNTAIHFVQHKSSVDLLMKAGADINIRNNKGDTVLHFFSYCDDNNTKRPRYLNPDFRPDRAEIIDSLISHGASPGIRNNKGYTPEDLLKMPCNKGLTRLLQSGNPY